MKNWSDYPIYLAVAETGSLTAAGLRLGISQPTVGRRIKVLEEDFGAPLLTKEDGNLVPTEFGYLILDHIRRMEVEAGAIMRSSATLEHSLIGPVRLAASEGLGDWWLPSVMQIFREANPDIVVDINIDFAETNLAQREADIALRWMGPGTQNSLIGRKLVTFGFGLYASEKYIERRGLPKTPEELLDHDGAVAAMSLKDQFWPCDQNGKPLPRPRTVFRSNNMLAHNHAVLAGFGIGMMAHASAIDPTKHGDEGLVRVLTEIERTEDLWIVAHEDLRRSARVRATFDFLVKSINADAAHFRSGAPTKFHHLCCHLDEPLAAGSEDGSTAFSKKVAELAQ